MKRQQRDAKSFKRGITHPQLHPDMVKYSTRLNSAILPPRILQTTAQTKLAFISLAPAPNHR